MQARAASARATGTSSSAACFVPPSSSRPAQHAGDDDDDVVAHKGHDDDHLADDREPAARTATTRDVNANGAQDARCRRMTRVAVLKVVSAPEDASGKTVDVPQEIPLQDKAVSLGRNLDKCDVTFPALPKVLSRHHAMFKPLTGDDAPGWCVRDEGSTNGTFINQNKLNPHEAVQLRTGDIVSFGPEWSTGGKLRYRYEGPNGDGDDDENDEMADDDIPLFTSLSAEDADALTQQMPSQQDAHSSEQKLGQTDERKAAAMSESAGESGPSLAGLSLGPAEASRAGSPVPVSAIATVPSTSSSSSTSASSCSSTSVMPQTDSRVDSGCGAKTWFNLRGWCSRASEGCNRSGSGSGSGSGSCARSDGTPAKKPQCSFSKCLKRRRSPADQGSPPGVQRKHANLCHRGSESEQSSDGQLSRTASLSTAAGASLPSSPAPDADYAHQRGHQHPHHAPGKPYLPHQSPSVGAQRRLEGFGHYSRQHMHSSPHAHALPHPSNPGSMFHPLQSFRPGFAQPFGQPCAPSPPGSFMNSSPFQTESGHPPHHGRHGHHHREGHHHPHRHHHHHHHHHPSHRHGRGGDGSERTFENRESQPETSPPSTVDSAAEAKTQACPFSSLMAIVKSHAESLCGAVGCNDKEKVMAAATAACDAVTKTQKQLESSKATASDVPGQFGTAAQTQLADVLVEGMNAQAKLAVLQADSSDAETDFSDAQKLVASMPLTDDTPDVAGAREAMCPKQKLQTIANARGASAVAALRAARAREAQGTPCQAGNGNKQSEQTEAMDTESEANKEGDATRARKGSSGIAELCSELVCPICQEALMNTSTLECNHMFCEPCINHWLAKSLNCPICRNKVFRAPTRSHPMDKIVLLALQSSRQQEALEGMVERKKEYEEQLAADAQRKELLEKALEKAVRNGNKFVEITRPWSSREQCRFLRGVHQYAGAPREAFCRSVSLTDEFVGVASLKDLHVAADNLRLGEDDEDVLNQMSVAQLRDRLLMFIAFG